jgi:putative transposase
VKGRKRHIIVDTNGFLLQVLVHEANIQDHHGGKLLLAPLGGCFPRLELIWADSGYKKGGFCEWVTATLGWTVEIVERTFAWLSTWRRLAKDYEVLPSSEETWIYLAMIRIMLRRLAQNSS